MEISQNLHQRVRHFVDFVSMEENSFLSPEQREIYELFINKYEQILEGTDVNQLLVNIDSEGGSGKSYLIIIIIFMLYRLLFACGASAQFDLQGKPCIGQVKTPAA